VEQAGIPVDLGLDADGSATHTYHLLPQRHAKILRRLMGKDGVFGSWDDFQGLTGEDGEAVGWESFIATSSGKVWETLEVFIPDLMPTARPPRSRFRTPLRARSRSTASSGSAR
jgi:hypothetical protein